MSSPTAGGVLNPAVDYKMAGDWQFNGTVTGRAFGDRTIRVAKVPLAFLHVANRAWQNPTGATIVVTRLLFNITVVSTGASTLDAGITATSAVTLSDTLLDGVSGASLAIFDSMNAALDSGANAKAQTVAAGKWVTITEASGDATGLTGDLYIEYFPL